MTNLILTNPYWCAVAAIYVTALLTYISTKEYVNAQS